MRRSDFLRGTIDQPLLRIPKRGRPRVIGIRDRIQNASRRFSVIGTGSLFPWIHHPNERDRVEREWGETDKLRRLKHHILTGSRRFRLSEENRDKIFTTADGIVAEDVN